MIRRDFDELMENFFDELRDVRSAGQKEYAHTEENVFRNFAAVAAETGQDQRLVLWTYLRKHLDGILAHIRGHRSQREPVRGRIKDAIMYLILLLGMEEEINEELRRVNRSNMDNDPDGDK